MRHDQKNKRDDSRFAGDGGNRKAAPSHWYGGARAPRYLEVGRMKMRDMNCEIGLLATCTSKRSSAGIGASICDFKFV